MSFAKESSSYEFEDFPATFDDPRGIKEKSPSFSGTLQDQSNKFWGQRGSEKLGDFSLIPLGSSNVAGKSSNS